MYVIFHSNFAVYIVCQCFASSTFRGIAQEVNDAVKDDDMIQLRHKMEYPTC